METTTTQAAETQFSLLVYSLVTVASTKDTHTPKNQVKIDFCFSLLFVRN